MEQENLKLKVSASPHVRSKATTSDIMFDVVIALVPAKFAAKIADFKALATTVGAKNNP